MLLAAAELVPMDVKTDVTIVLLAKVEEVLLNTATCLPVARVGS
jgi:hypothetical protein